KLIGWAFWLINIGLLVMVTISLLPIGIMQSVASIKEGYWYARSAEFMQTDTMHFLRWLRVPGDILLAAGELLFVIFIIGLKFGWSLKEKR
ncbi:MAG: nitric-oxide reductase large subunit, partial [Chryseobacterium culicis]